MDYCKDKSKDGGPWLSFLQIDASEIKDNNNTLIFFCKEFCIEKNELKYRGLVNFNGDGSCFDLFKIVSDKFQIPRSKEFGILAEAGNFKLSGVSPFGSIDQILLLKAVSLNVVF